MPSKVYSAAVVGVEAFEVEIEVHAGLGEHHKIAVVGLPDTAVKESKDRVTSAISNSSLRWPYGKRITINLAPADVRSDHAFRGISHGIIFRVPKLCRKEKARPRDIGSCAIASGYSLYRYDPSSYEVILRLTTAKTS
jgi:Subunit ChlI of Mg-chelatase